MTFDEGRSFSGTAKEDHPGPCGRAADVQGAQRPDGRTLTAFENVIAPGDGPPLHTHERQGESWYVLEGSLRFKLGSTIHGAAAGSFVYAPAGTPHCFQNVGDTPARLLVLFSPSGMETFLDHFAELPAGEVDPSVFEALGRMPVVGPPLAVSDPLRCDGGLSRAGV